MDSVKDILNSIHSISESELKQILISIITKNEKFGQEIGKEIGKEIGRPIFEQLPQRTHNQIYQIYPQYPIEHVPEILRCNTVLPILPNVYTEQHNICNQGLLPVPPLFPSQQLFSQASFTAQSCSSFQHPHTQTNFISLPAPQVQPNFISLPTPQAQEAQLDDYDINTFEFENDYADFGSAAVSLEKAITEQIQKSHIKKQKQKTISTGLVSSIVIQNPNEETIGLDNRIDFLVNRVYRLWEDIYGNQNLFGSLSDAMVSLFVKFWIKLKQPIFFTTETKSSQFTSYIYCSSCKITLAKITSCLSEGPDQLEVFLVTDKIESHAECDRSKVKDNLIKKLRKSNKLNDNNVKKIEVMLNNIKEVCCLSITIASKIILNMNISIQNLLRYIEILFDNEIKKCLVVSTLQPNTNKIDSVVDNAKLQILFELMKLNYNEAHMEPNRTLYSDLLKSTQTENSSVKLLLSSIKMKLKRSRNIKGNIEDDIVANFICMSKSTTQYSDFKVILITSCEDNKWKIFSVDTNVEVNINASLGCKDGIDPESHDIGGLITRMKSSNITKIYGLCVYSNLTLTVLSQIGPSCVHFDATFARSRSGLNTLVAVVNDNSKSNMVKSLCFTYDSESYDLWSVYIKVDKALLLLYNNELSFDSWEIFSDQHYGLSKAIKDSYSEAYLRTCSHHLLDNLLKHILKKDKNTFVRVYYQGVNTTIKDYCLYCVQTLKTLVIEQSTKRINQIPSLQILFEEPEKIFRILKISAMEASKSSFLYTGIHNTNAVESFNGLILEARREVSPLCQVLLTYNQMIMHNKSSIDKQKSIPYSAFTPRFIKEVNINLFLSSYYSAKIIDDIAVDSSYRKFRITFNGKDQPFNASVTKNILETNQYLRSKKAFYNSKLTASSRNIQVEENTLSYIVLVELDESSKLVGRVTCDCNESKIQKILCQHCITCLIFGIETQQFNFKGDNHLYEQVRDLRSRKNLNAVKLVNIDEIGFLLPEGHQVLQGSDFYTKTVGNLGLKIDKEFLLTDLSLYKTDILTVKDSYCIDIESINSLIKYDDVEPPKQDAPQFKRGLKASDYSSQKKQKK